MSGPTVSTAQGKLAGTLADDVAVFRGVPYAAPPLGALRWAPPAPHPGWAGVRDAAKDGPAPPQLPSRLERVMGRVDFANGQGEDCLTLTISAPWPASGGKRPVMVFFHGGAWMSGAGSLSLYGGAELARFADAVVIGVNYRLGALGYLHVPELPAAGSGANYGLLDHVAALAWVRDNIASFGGDPANVTIFGQSAGGGSIATLMEMPDAVKLFRRAILQSAAVMPHVTPDAARRVTDEVLKALGLDRARIAALREVPVAKLLDAQRAAMMAIGKPTDPTPVYRMVHDGKVLTTDPPAGVAAGRAKGIDVMIGTTRDEVHAFFINNDAFANIDRAGMANALKPAAGTRAPRPSSTPTRSACPVPRRRRCSRPSRPTRCSACPRCASPRRRAGTRAPMSTASTGSRPRRRPTAPRIASSCPSCSAISPIGTRRRRRRRC